MRKAFNNVCIIALLWAIISLLHTEQRNANAASKPCEQTVIVPK